MKSFFNTYIEASFHRYICIAGIIMRSNIPLSALAGIKNLNCVNCICIVLIYNAAYDPLWHQSV